MSEQSTITPLQKDINQAVSSAKFLVINDANGLQLASSYLKSCNLRIKAVGKAFDHIVSAAHEAHKAATTERKRHLDPVNQAKAIINSKVAVYHREQERIRAEKEAAARQKAREEQEALKIAEAQALQEEGLTEEAEAILDEERPLEIVAEPEPEPEPEGLSYRDNWQFELLDLSKVPSEYLVLNEKAVRQVVKALKDKTNIPGIKVFNKKTVIQKV